MRLREYASALRTRTLAIKPQRVRGGISILPLGKVDSSVVEGIHQWRGHGRSLDPDVRAQLEPVFAAGLGAVRIQTGKASDQLNRALKARAFTVGRDIFFRETGNAPESPVSRGLLAHELTHVLQQTEAVPTQLSVSDPGDVYEQGADRTAAEVVCASTRAALTEPVVAPQTRAASPRGSSIVGRKTISRRSEAVIQRFTEDMPYVGALKSYLNPFNQAMRLILQPLSPQQKALLDGIFGLSFATSLIRLYPNSPLGFGKCNRTAGNLIHLTAETIDDEHLIHEAAHVWQSQNTTFGVGYAVDALTHMALAEGLHGDWEKAYDYSQVEMWHVPWRYWNAEQQARWIQHNRRLPSGWMLEHLFTK